MGDREGGMGRQDFCVGRGGSRACIVGFATGEAEKEINTSL